MNDPENHPSHYTDGNIEVIDFIEDKKFGYCLGNAIKYISRAGKKNPDTEIEDLQKAVWYINRRISELCKVQKTDGRYLFNIYRLHVDILLAILRPQSDICTQQKTPAGSKHKEDTTWKSDLNLQEQPGRNW